MSRNILYALIGSLLLHGGFAIGGHFLNAAPKEVEVKEEAPTIELAPMPPIEPDEPDKPDATDEAPPPETAEIPPPSIADTPSVSMDSPFEQQIQPPPANVNRPTGTINIPMGGARSAVDKSKNVFDLASLDQKPVQTFSAKANHPFELQRARIGGSATVSFIQDANGSVRDVVVVDATHREFGLEAVKAVSKYKFRPGKKNGKEVNTRMVITINFKLPGSE